MDFIKPARIEEMLAPLFEQEGAELVDVLVRYEKGKPLLTIFADKPGGITLQDCESLSERVGSLLDQSSEPELSRAYSLEVSSPGIDRIVKKEADFKRFAGKRMRLRLKEPRDGRSNFHGTLKGFEGGDVLLEFNAETWRFALAAIQEARLDLAAEVLKEL